MENTKLETNAQKTETLELETINQYIDMGIVEFTQKINTKSFSEVNGMIKLIEMEHSRLIQLRNRIAKEFADVQTKSVEFDSLFIKYVTTFVLEQKIVDRKAILSHVATLKGVNCILRTDDYNIFKNHARTSSATGKSSMTRSNSNK